MTAVDATNTATIRVEGSALRNLDHDRCNRCRGHVVHRDGRNWHPQAPTRRDNRRRCFDREVTGTLGGQRPHDHDGRRRAFAHAAGVTVEFPFPATVAGVTNTLSVNNGTNTETSTPVLIEEGTPTAPPTAYPFFNYSASGTGANLATLDPGTYSITAYLPGFGFTTGAAVTLPELHDSVALLTTTASLAPLRSSTATWPLWRSPFPRFVPATPAIT